MGYKTYNCPISKQCGGCEWLNVPYPIQLKRKQKYIEELFEPLCKDLSMHMYEIDGMENPTRCRNKIIVPFGSNKKGAVIYGLYAKNSHRIVQKDDCFVEDALAAPILKTIASLAKSFKIYPYNEKTGMGFLRYVLLRIGASTGEVLVCLVCAGKVLKSSKAFVRELRKRHPQISTVVLNTNSRNTNVVLGEQEHILYGKGWIEDEILGCKFRISAGSFFQVNPRQTQKLYSCALEMAGVLAEDSQGDGSKASSNKRKSDSSISLDSISPTKDDSPNSSTLTKNDSPISVLDAYCGTGTIGIIAAKCGAYVAGVESNSAAVKDAKSNARRNKIDSIKFELADASDFMSDCAKNSQTFDVVIMDPPRAGADEKFLKSLAQMAPSKIVYISCNPKTQVRDCSYLLKRGYRISKIQPMDMFPHTPHVETVVLMSKVQK